MTPLDIIASVTVQQRRAGCLQYSQFIKSGQADTTGSTNGGCNRQLFSQVLVARNSVLKCSLGCFLQRAVRYFFQSAQVNLIIAFIDV